MDEFRTGGGGGVASSEILFPPRKPKFYNPPPAMAAAALKIFSFFFFVCIMQLCLPPPVLASIPEEGLLCSALDCFKYSWIHLFIDWDMEFCSACSCFRPSVAEHEEGIEGREQWAVYMGWSFVRAGPLLLARGILWQHHLPRLGTVSRSSLYPLYLLTFSSFLIKPLTLTLTLTLNSSSKRPLHPAAGVWTYSHPRAPPRLCLCLLISLTVHR